MVVLALPRGGVPVAYEVAQALDARLDVFLVRKLGLPGHPSRAMGAIASGGVRVLNNDVVSWYRIPETVIEHVAEEEQRELARRERMYREGRAPVELQGRLVILVDDGLATGSTMKAAVEAVHAHGPSRIVVAVSVSSLETCREFAEAAEEIIGDARLLLIGEATHRTHEFYRTQSTTLRCVDVGASQWELGLCGPHGVAQGRFLRPRSTAPSRPIGFGADVPETVGTRSKGTPDAKSRVIDESN